MIAEQLHDKLTKPAPAELPAVTVRDEGGLYRLITVRARLRTWRAYLHPRTRRLVAAAIQHVIDARADGGMTITIELSGPTDGGPAHGCAAAVMLSIAAGRVVIALLDAESRPLTAVRLDQASIDALTGEAP